MLLYLAVSLFIFFCPVYSENHPGMYRRNVYWRVLWLVPSTPVIAYAMTEFLRERKKLWKPLFSGRVCCPDRIMRKGIYQAGIIILFIIIRRFRTKWRESAIW